MKPYDIRKSVFLSLVLLFLSFPILLMGQSSQQDDNAKLADIIKGLQEVDRLRNFSNDITVLEIKGVIYDFRQAGKDWLAVNMFGHEVSKQVIKLLKNDNATESEGEEVKRQLAAHQNMMDSFEKKYGKYFIGGKILQTKTDGVLILTDPEGGGMTAYRGKTVFVSGHTEQQTLSGIVFIKPVLGLPMGQYQYDENGITKDVMRFEVGVKPTKPYRIEDVKQLPK